MTGLLSDQVEELTKALIHPEPGEAAAAAGAAQGNKPAGAKGSLSSSAAGGASGGGGRGGLRGLQDVRGEWRGAVQAYGGGGGATSVDFDLKGQAWEWGDYGLDQVRVGYRVAVDSQQATWLSSLRLLCCHCDCGIYPSTQGDQWCA